MAQVRDEILIERARKAAEELSLALNEAADTGLILECTAKPSGWSAENNKIVRQNNWTVRVFGSRTKHY